MHQAFHIHLIQSNKNTESCNSADGTIKGLAHFILHVETLEPGFHITRSIVGATLENGVVTLTDLQSTNGTFVNNERATEAGLFFGDAAVATGRLIQPCRPGLLGGAADI